MSENIFSRCGNRCDLCLVFRPNVQKADRREAICAVFSKAIPGYNPDPKTTICDGCLGADAKGAVLLTEGCKARECVIKRGLEHCGYCPYYPCEIFPAEPDADAFYAEMKLAGVDWTAQDDAMMEPYNPKRFMDEFQKTQGRKL